MKHVQKLLVFLIIILAVLFFSTSDPKIISSSLAIESIPENLSPEDFLKEQKNWTQRIQEVGAEKAYGEFKQAYAKVHFGDQHTMSHIIGSEIYEASGIQGVSICDNTFAFGCYHGFFARALSERGTSIVKQLDDACVAKFGVFGTGCQHGIGHGLMEYFGPSRLVETLKACEPTTAQSELAGCVSGVFMEYNVPIVVSGTAAQAVPRDYDPKKSYGPCPELPDKFQPSCYYEIPAWWNQTLNHDYRQMGVLCADVPDVKQEDTCFLGAGNVVGPSSNYRVDVTIDNCNMMPDQKAIIDCLAGASWSFDANPDYKSLAQYLCDKLVDEPKLQCEHKAHILNPENSHESAN